MRKISSYIFHHSPGILAATDFRIMLRNNVLAFTGNATPFELRTGIWIHKINTQINCCECSSSSNRHWQNAQCCEFLLNITWCWPVSTAQWANALSGPQCLLGLTGWWLQRPGFKSRLGWFSVGWTNGGYVVRTISWTGTDCVLFKLWQAIHSGIRAPEL